MQLDLLPCGGPSVIPANAGIQNFDFLDSGSCYFDRLALNDARITPAFRKHSINSAPARTRKIPGPASVDIAEFFLAPIRPPGHNSTANADFQWRLVERKRLDLELGFSHRSQAQLGIRFAEANRCGIDRGRVERAPIILIVLRLRL